MPLTMKVWSVLHGQRIISVVAAVLIWYGWSIGVVAGNEPFTDLGIGDAIEDELQRDEAVPLDDIDVRISDGVVNLSGHVDNMLAKERAVRIAQTVKGVKAVVDRIEVVPSILRSDSEIEDDVENAFFFNPATESYEVNVWVDNNEVILTGTVESWQEKMLAVKIAKGVIGVVAVQDNIDVQPKQQRSDQAIQADIEQALRWNVYVDDGLIQVNVKNGKVTLSGTVGSLAEKAEASAIARVAGVVAVDARDLEVKRWRRDEDLRSEKHVIKSDIDIKNAIEDALQKDPRVSSLTVYPDVKAGVVTLRGTADNLQAKRAAGRDARHTVGVLRVRNRIKVRPGEKIGDAEIESEIRAAFVRDPLLNWLETTVTVVDHVAYLNGRVDSYYDKARADEIAASINGVKAVKNYLAIKDPNAPYVSDPYVDDWSIRDFGWYAYKPGYSSKGDAEIRDDIENELFWSPFVDSENIQVSVENRIATLSGTADTMAEKSMAEANAFEGGAIHVINRLNVR